MIGVPSIVPSIVPCGFSKVVRSGTLVDSTKSNFISGSRSHPFSGDVQEQKGSEQSIEDIRKYEQSICETKIDTNFPQAKETATRIIDLCASYAMTPNGNNELLNFSYSYVVIAQEIKSDLLKNPKINKDFKIIQENLLIFLKVLNLFPYKIKNLIVNSNVYDFISVFNLTKTFPEDIYWDSNNNPRSSTIQKLLDGIMPIFKSLTSEDKKYYEKSLDKIESRLLDIQSGATPPDWFTYSGLSRKV